MYLKLANPNLKTKIKAKKLAGQKALDKFKKASLALREHKKLKREISMKSMKQENE